MIRKLTFVAALSALGLFISGGTAQAAGMECGGSFCGTPNQSGGGGCGCGGGSILVNNTDVGDTYQYADDFDSDGFEDDYDNCPFVSNVAQVDSDGDGFGDLCDSCRSVVNPAQLDTDGDGLGDQCDADMDNDGVLNTVDNCVKVQNIGQKNTDSDKFGDACDIDDDNDGVLDIKDNCPLVANPAQKNDDPNRFGNACDNDRDLDNIPDSKDNCPSKANLDQSDLDKDGIGDLCDADIDNDKIVNTKDNCATVFNPSQRNGDRDKLGDACDPKFCYVVRTGDKSYDEQRCLDPTTVFAVFSPDAKVKVGKKLRLRLFANRQQRAMEYTWRVIDRPSGSTATVSNPRGKTNVSATYEYFYLKNKAAIFAPDEPGTYTVELSARLLFPDTANPAWPQKAQTYTMTITATGESSGGCSVGNSSAAGSTALVLLGLLGLVLVRRRR